MVFSLTNAPSVFQHLSNDIFQEFLNIFVTIYLDNTLIFSKTRKKHDEHVRQILQQLQEYGFHVKLKKCTFYCNQLEILGYIVSQCVQITRYVSMHSGLMNHCGSMLVFNIF